MARLLARAARSATEVVPVIGRRTVGQLGDYLAALGLHLNPPSAAKRIDSGVRPVLPVV